MSAKSDHDDVTASQTDHEQAPVSVTRLYRFAFAKILVIVLWALLFAGAVLSVANDMYAFVKPQKEIAFTVESPLSIEELSQQLEQADIVTNPFIFHLYVRSKNKIDRIEAFSGQVSLNTAMSYRELISAFSSEATE